MTRVLLLWCCVALAGCAPDYSPNTYATAAVQQANKVDQGVIVGFRQVSISPQGTVGAVTGGAAGGIAGSQAGSGVVSAFGALGGSLIGGLVGSTVEKTEGNTPAWEYIVKKLNGDLLSVVQKDDKPLVLGQHVLLIAGAQARVVPDYTVPPDQVASSPPPRPAAPPAAPPVPSLPVPVTSQPLAPPMPPQAALPE